MSNLYFSEMYRVNVGNLSVYEILGRCVPRVLATTKYAHGLTLNVGSVNRWGLSTQFVGKAQELLGASRSYNTMRVARSALNKVSAIEDEFGVDLSFPWNLSSSANFVMGAVEMGLRASSIRNYCSQIKQAHLDGGFEWRVDMSLANRLLRGTLGEKGNVV